MDQSKRLDYLDLLRGFAIILVVGIHAYGYAISGDQPGDFPVLRAIRSHLSIAVPIFFMVDGFLMSRSQTRAVPPTFGEVARKGARRLLVPWAIFTVIYVGLRALFELRGMFPKHMVIGLSPREVASNVFYSLIAMQLYFLPALFLMRLTVVPLRGLWRGPIGGYLAAWLGYVMLLQVLPIANDSDPFSSMIVGFPYFLFGALLAKLESREAKSALMVLGILAVAGILQEFVAIPRMTLAGKLEVAKYSYIVVAYLVARRLSSSPAVLLWLGRHTMEIYLLHAPVLIKIVQLIVSKLTSKPSWQFAGIWAVCLGLTVLLTLVLKKVPRSGLLFGQG